MGQWSLDQDDMTCNGLISACGSSRRQRWDLSLHLVALLGATGLAATSITRNALLSAVERAGHWRHVLAGLRDPRGASPAPDEVAYSAAIRACAAGRCRRAREAALSLEEMHKE